MEKNNKRLQDTYAAITANEVRYEEFMTDDAEYLIVAFGCTSRICRKAIENAREQGIRVGMLRPVTLWPFPTQAIAGLAERMKGILVAELNAGQMVEDVRLAAGTHCGKVRHFGRTGGIVPNPQEIIDSLTSHFPEAKN